jgi:energy-coupling factor transporter ATP-binding protein EcfA2
MLEKLKLHNFKGHQDTELTFDRSRLHALVGKNASGKTSVLQSLNYLNRLDDVKWEDFFKSQNSPEFFTSVGHANLSVVASGSWNLKKWWAMYEFRQRDNDWTARKQYKNDSDRPAFTVRPMNMADPPEPLPENLKSIVYLKLVATNLAKATYSEAITPQVEFDGSGLAPTLDYLRSEYPKNFQDLQEMLRRIVPVVKTVGIGRAKVMVDRQRLIEVDGKSISYGDSQEVTGQEVFLETTNGRIYAHAASEGTMIALGLLTVLMSPQKPSLVLLDDVEQGLHPKAQRELMTVFKEILQANENLQIIFSTHSPYIVDELEPSQVHILSNPKAGFTHVKRLDEHPDVEWAKQTLTTGEFWGAEGEDWVVEGEENA